MCNSRRNHIAAQTQHKLCCALVAAEVKHNNNNNNRNSNADKHSHRSHSTQLKWKISNTVADSYFSSEKFCVEYKIVKHCSIHTHCTYVFVPFCRRSFLFVLLFFFFFLKSDDTFLFIYVRNSKNLSLPSVGIVWLGLVWLCSVFYVFCVRYISGPMTCMKNTPSLHTLMKKCIN